MGVVNRDGSLYMATGIDNSGLKQDAAEAEQIIEDIGVKSEKTSSRMQRSFESMEAVILSAKDTMVILEKTISSLNTRIDNHSSSSSEDAKRVAELEAALTDLNAKYEALNKTVPTSSEEIKKSGNDAKQATTDYNALSKSLNNAWKTLGVGISVAGLKAFGKEVINVTGEMEMLQSSFEVLLGGKGVTGFMSEMKQFAVDSPLSMNGVANAAQTLLGFGISAEKVMPTIKQIGDISMGNEERFKSLSLAFAQMSATGKLMGQDLLQMINAGFNPLQIISEKTGKSIADLKKEMESGSISSDMIAQAFASATEKGGKFYGMTQKQAEGIKGLEAQLDGEIQDAFNNLGKSQEGLIKGGYNVAISLVGNYEKIGKILMSLIAAYGTYRTVLILTSAVEKARNSLAVYDISTKTINIALTKKHTAELIKQMYAQSALNKVIKANPYILFGSILLGVATSMWALHDSSTAAEKAMSVLNKQIEAQTKANDDEISSVENLISVIKDDVKTRLEKQKALDVLQAKYPAIFSNLDIEKIKNLELADALRQVNLELERRGGAQSQNNIDRAKEIRNLYKTDTIKGRSLAKSFLGKSWYDMQSDKGLIDELEEYIKQADSRLQNEESARNRGVFNNLPKNKRLDILKEEIGDLKSQYDRLKTLDEQEKNNPFSTGFSSYSTQLDQLERQINAKNGQIKSIESDVDKASVRDKAYWEKQKKDAETKLDALSDIAAKGKEGDILRKEIQTYNDKLKVYDAKDNSKSTDSAAEKARKKGEDLKKATEKQYSENIRSAKDLEFQLADAEIKAMEEGSLKVLAQLDLNYTKEKEALKRQQEDALKTKKDNARAIFEADEKNKGKSFDDSSIKLEQSELDKYKQLEQKSNEIYAKDKLNIELQYMRDYISEYGSFQQRKLEIAKEYDKKIAAASSSWEKKTLENQKQSAISAIDIEAINKKIDWQSVLGDFTGVMGDQLKELLSNLKEYIKTDQFKQLSVTDQKTVYDAIEKLRTVTPGGEGTLNFNEIKRQMSELGVAINLVQEAELNVVATSEKLARAQDAYENAIKSGSQELAKTAKEQLDDAQSASIQANNQLNEANTNVSNLANGVKQSTQDTINGLNMVADGLSSFASGSLAQAFSGIQKTLTGLSKVDLGQTANQAIAKLVSSFGGEIGQIIGAVLSVLDVLKDGIGTLVSDLIDLVLNAVDGILKDILSFDISVKIANSLKEGLGNILNTISFGGFNSLVSSINGGNAKETAQIISRLTASNEALKVSVDALKDEMAGSNGSKSIDAYNDAVAAQERYTENLRKILDTQMRYSNSHHSNAYYWDLNPDSLKEINKTLGTNLSNSWADFATLTPEQLDKIRKHLPDIWSELINQGKYGDRFKDDWNNYADQAGKVGELTDELRENIAQISFDNLRDSFVNALMDMDKKAADFADNFEEYLTRALLNFAIGDLLDSRLKDWYNNWTNTMNKQGGKLNEDQIAQKKKEWDDIVADAIDIRDNITNSTGYTGKDSKQKASTGYSASMSQDTGEKIEGRMTGMQMNLISIDATAKMIMEMCSSNNILFKEMVGRLKESRDIDIQSMYYLMDISEYAKELPLIKKILEDIKQNTLSL